VFLPFWFGRRADPRIRDLISTSQISPALQFQGAHQKSARRPGGSGKFADAANPSGTVIDRACHARSPSAVFDWRRSGGGAQRSDPGRGAGGFHRLNSNPFRAVKHDLASTGQPLNLFPLPPPVFDLTGTRKRRGIPRSEGRYHRRANMKPAITIGGIRVRAREPAMSVRPFPRP